MEVHACLTSRRSSPASIVAPRDAREVLVPPDGACTGAELALGEGLSCTADPGRFKVCRGADAVTLLPDEDTIVAALLPLLDVP